MNRSIFMVLCLIPSSAILPLFAAVQLTIGQQATNGVVVTWPSAGAYTLQTNNSLTTTNWAAYVGAIVNNNGTNTVTTQLPTGNRFFRLKNVGTTAFTSPTNILNTVAFWNYRDAPLGSTLSWTDEVSGIVLTNWGTTYVHPTNTGMGWYFYNSGMTNNPALTISNSFSIWYVAGPVFAGGQVYGSVDRNNSISLTSAPQLDGYWSSDHIWSGYTFGHVTPGVIVHAPLWQDVADVQGTVATNGVLTSGSIGQPAGNVTFSALANTSSGNGAMWPAYVKYLLVSTNHSFTTGELTNLYNWEITNGVTNVSSGLVGWWKFNDKTNYTSNTNLADASGNGLTGNICGAIKPVWTNGLNSVVSQALYFDGTNNWVNVPCNSPLSGPYLSVSFWVNFTNDADSGAFIAGYANSNNFLGSIGPASQGMEIYVDPGTSLIRGSVEAANGGYIEANAVSLGSGDWHHYVYATDGTNQLTWFDGVRCLGQEGGSVAINNNGGSPVVGWASGWTNIQFSAANYQAHQQGMLTDVRIYGRMLGDGEVDILYRAPAADQVLGAYIY